jgi:hypothetical protein
MYGEGPFKTPGSGRRLPLQVNDRSPDFITQYPTQLCLVPCDPVGLYQGYYYFHYPLILAAAHRYRYVFLTKVLQWFAGFLTEVGGRRAILQANDPATQGVTHQLDLVTQAQFLQDVISVGIDRAVTDSQLVGNLQATETFGCQR